mmetsp:Transcript_46626/g.122925  ORF Transcript_46626/g.122925 Transcript_46626/m.122925 type:complete len:208 (+) Transcript_46626:168-791(+)
MMRHLMISLHATCFRSLCIHACMSPVIRWEDKQKFSTAPVAIRALPRPRRYGPSLESRIADVTSPCACAGASHAPPASSGIAQCTRRAACPSARAAGPGAPSSPARGTPQRSPQPLAAAIARAPAMRSHPLPHRRPQRPTGSRRTAGGGGACGWRCGCPFGIRASRAPPPPASSAAPSIPADRGGTLSPQIDGMGEGAGRPPVSGCV